MPERAEIEALAREAREIAETTEHPVRLETLIDQLEDAALDRVRDARDGTVAVEDVVAWVRQQPHGEGWARWIEERFGSARAGERWSQGEDHEAPEFDEQAITDILVAIDDTLEGYGRERMDLIDGPTVDALRDAVKRELVAFVARPGESNEGGNQ